MFLAGVSGGSSIRGGGDPSSNSFGFAAQGAPSARDPRSDLPRIPNGLV